MRRKMDPIAPAPHHSQLFLHLWHHKHSGSSWIMSPGVDLEINTLHGSMVCTALMQSGGDMEMQDVAYSTRGSTGKEPLERGGSALSLLVPR